MILDLELLTNISFSVEKVGGQNLNRNYIGLEKEEKYFDICQKRLICNQ